MLTGRSILITGGTGSFGQAFVREVLRRPQPRRLVVYSRDEQKQHRMAQEFSPAEHKCLRYFIGDVRDAARLRRAMDGIEFVVHAAAMKHVPITEYNPFECIRTNVGGAENVIEAAIDRGVRRVLTLSTDKAVAPINLYGATKLAAEKCFVAANHLGAAGGTRFSVVRYGNVMGSRGSVVETFRALVDKGERRLPITDGDMTRFFITLRRGVAFVLDRLDDMRGGEVFVPKIPSLRIVDLMTALGGESVRHVGRRAGEKIHETLIAPDEAHYTWELPGHYEVRPVLSIWGRPAAPRPGEPAAQAVRAGFRYTSNENEPLLSVEEIQRLLREA